MPSSSQAWTFVTTSAEQTAQVAETLGALLEGGDVVGLIGDLGTGKTCFSQGLARGLGVDRSAYVSSPTFALIQCHRGRVPFCHVDLYRLEDPDESVYIGYDDLFDGRGVIAIEWFDRFPELWPESFLQVVLREGPGDDDRVVQVTARGARPEQLLRQWRERG